MLRVREGHTGAKLGNAVSEAAHFRQGGWRFAYPAGMTDLDEARPPRTAADVMTSHPACCTPETPLARVAQLMVLQDCGEIPVVDNEENGVPIGVVTDRDIVCRIVARGKNPLEHTAEACMSQPVVTIDEDTPVKDLLSVMEKHQIRRIPVVNKSGRCIGVVSQADVAWKGQQRAVSKLVREVSRNTDLPAR
jgi:CBS domain-containing protein